jgi:hypothetical protein
MYPVPVLAGENIRKPVEDPNYSKGENKRECDCYIFELAHDIAIAV